MTYTIESKNQLAKLLATENITIEHRKVKTASFDIKSRILICPIWKNMSGDVYDLFMGHEVGHALETPFEGWHDNVSNKGINYKHFLNVVEDARIEKKIKRRYPGLKRSFISAYNHLMNEDFFGVKNLDTNTLSLIDKINLYFKGGINSGIKFTDNEIEYVKQVESCETWDDVVSVTDKLFAYCKDEQQKIKQDHDFNSSEESEDDEFGESEESEDGEFKDSEDDKSEESEDVEFEESEDDKSEESEDVEFEESEDDDIDESVDQNNENEFEDYDDDFEPECKTEQSFRQKESLLLDDSCLPYVYIKIPKPNLNHIVTPQNRVNEILTDYYKDFDRKKQLDDFKRKNLNYVGLLAKEFEMRKAASKYEKRKTSDIGDIDVNKIYKYKLEDNIFRKITKFQNGKSHGLILLLDCSGSMTANFNGAIEQIMVLTMFCRRVNIPFAVYGFGNNNYSWNTDYPEYKTLPRKCFSDGPNELRLNNVSLREYLNSEMSNSAFNNALSNLAILKSNYESRAYIHGGIPPTEVLSNTPLIQAMIAMKSVVEDFRKKRKLDIVNLAIVHDGDADFCTNYSNNDNNKTESIRSEGYNYILVDKDNNLNFPLPRETCRNILPSICEWFTKTTNTKIFGFFIVSNSRGAISDSLINSYYKDGKNYLLDVVGKNKKYWQIKKMDETHKLVSIFRATKFLVSDKPGYEKFFMILGGKTLVTDYDDLQVEKNVSISKLKKAFSKKYNNRKTNRILVNSFIQGIAA